MDTETLYREELDVIVNGLLALFGEMNANAQGRHDRLDTMVILIDKLKRMRDAAPSGLAS